MSETVVKPGEFAKPNPEALALVDGTAASGGGIIPRAEFNGDGGYTPPEAKIYFETMDIAYGVGFGAQIGAPAGSWGDPGAVEVAAQDPDDREHEEPEGHEQPEAQDRQGEFAHGRLAR